MNDEREQTPEGESLSIALQSIVRASRRRLLAMLATLPAARGLAAISEPGASGAKKKGKRNKKKHKKKRGGQNGGGGGTYAPDGEERAFLDLINDYRDQKGAAALSLNDQLGRAAEHHSNDMAKKNYFSHKLSNGDSAEENIRRFGYTNYEAVGENIAAGNDSASKTFEQWKKSNDHNQNMLSQQYDEIGIGRAYSKKSKYGWYWTTTFGSR